MCAIWGPFGALFPFVFLEKNPGDSAVDERENERRAQERRELEDLTTRSKSRKRLAWECLQQSRNPLYVSLRYGYPVAMLEKALETLPEAPPPTFKPHLPRHAAGDTPGRSGRFVRASGELLGETGSRPDMDQPEVREPGCDDDLGDED